MSRTINAGRTPKIEIESISGDLSLVGWEGEDILLKADEKLTLRSGATSEDKRGSIALCRCGQSGRKPFCDSTHKTCAFESVIVAFDLPVLP